MWQDLDEDAFMKARVGRSVASDISALVNNTEEFTASFEGEANFCAGST